jgi:hypothetical protein
VDLQVVGASTGIMFDSLPHRGGTRFDTRG